MMDEMCMAFGGRAAEEIVFGKISTGALSDLERITKMAYSIVTIYGMNPASVTCRSMIQNNLSIHSRNHTPMLRQRRLITR